jgi:hypothetical protein
MRAPSPLSLLLGLGLLGGCPKSEDTDTDDTSDTDTADTDTDTDTDTDSDVVLAPPIHEALDCGTLGEVGGLGGGTEMQRHDFDLEQFPLARCNDGTAAFFYFRPGVNTGVNRWAIQLQGGGSCNSPESCFDRWCSADTNFGMQGMTANASPANTNGRGILERIEDNPLGDYNHVFVRYCSSDVWAGTTSDVQVTGPHPLTDVEVTATMQFQGANIVDAVLDTLRQDGVPGLTYTLDGGSTPMPDLDAAHVVVFAGASAGGAGVANQGDRVAALLAEHSECEGAGCPLDVFLLIDSITGPLREDLPFDQNRLCLEADACTWDEAMALDATLGSGPLQAPLGDASCEAQQGTAGHAHWCLDPNFVVHNHITTPMFVRMGQFDTLIGSSYIDGGLVPDGQAFAAGVREDMLALTDPDNAAEGAAMTKAPGVFAPACSDHETLSDHAQVYDATIDVAGDDLSMFDAIRAWRLGTTVEPAIASEFADGFCPPPAR